MEKADLIIVGGGLVGAALALSLRNSALDIVLLEGKAPQTEWPQAQWDARVYAISRASRKLLEGLGAWGKARTERFCPVSAMQIRGDDAQSRLDFAALESGVDELAYICENRELLRGLWLALAEAPNVRIISPAEPQTLTVSESGVVVTLADGRALGAKLVVGADGAQSWVRRQLDIGTRQHAYGQYGVVANFTCEKPHLGVARQWFMPDGILAWLPLAGQRMSMVWSCHEAHKEELLALDAASLCARVAAAGGNQLGALTLLTPAAAFPLKVTHVNEVGRAHIALVGDAAHTIHPLAGQGVNLGFGDVAALSRILKTAHPARIGDLALMQRYERERREAVLLMQGTCHGLQQLFNNHNPVLKTLRNIGLSMTNQLPWLKRQLIRHAMDS